MKPVVIYKELGSIREGERALIIPVDHPGNANDGTWSEVVNNEPAWTSTVQTYDELTGNFETRNTQYIKST